MSAKDDRRSWVSWEAILPIQQQQAPGDEPRPAHKYLDDVLDFRQPTLLDSKSADAAFGVRVDHLLGRWFERRPDVESALQRLTDPFYAPYMSSEHRYSATIQRTEAMHDNIVERDVRLDLFSMRGLPSSQHRAGVAKVIETLRNANGDLEDESLDWAEKLLLQKNGRSPQQEVKAVLESAGAAGAFDPRG